MRILGSGKNIRSKLGGLVLTAAALNVAHPSLLAQNSIPISAPIEGTWIVQVHRVSQNVTFTALQSFTAGGVTLATGTLDRTPPPAISPLYGTWKRVGENSYSTSLSFFIFDNSGGAIAMLQNYESFHLNAKNEIVGTGTAYLCNTSGENCMNVETLTITGTRMSAQHP